MFGRTLSVLAFLFLSVPVVAADIVFEAVERVPTASLRMGDTALVAPIHFERLGIEPGQKAFLESEAGNRVSVYLLPIGREENSVSLRRTLRDRLGVTPGEAQLALTLSDGEETDLPPLDIGVRIETNPGLPEEWDGILLGAPHADGDRHTGEIAGVITELSGVPSVTGWQGRLSFMGRWVDVNRPLQRVPDEEFSLLSWRSWTPKAEDVYAEYRHAILSLADAYGPAPGEPPLDLYVDFHGHGLTAPMPDDTRVPRPVFENMVRGYTLEEVRRLQELFDASVRAEFGEDAPPSYWGNLPEQRRYEVEGVEVNFAYSGLGGRMSGALNPAISRRAIHIETPQVLRMQEENRPGTARAIAGFLEAVREEFHSPGPKWVEAPGGEFHFGTGDPEETITQVDPFLIGRTQVTNNEYVQFANEALSAGEAVLEEGVLTDAGDGTPWLFLAPEAVHSAVVSWEDDILSALPGMGAHPVVHVTWHGARAYAAHVGGRLPSEIEWEYAAKWDPEAGTSTGWREESDPEHARLPDGNYMHSPQRENRSISGTTTPVGTFPGGASPVGCLDLAGNVWEWTADWYDTQNVEGQGGTMRAIRGGSWDTEPVTVQAESRAGVAPHAALPTLGFRVSRSVE